MSYLYERQTRLIQETHEIVVRPAGLVKVVGLQQHLRQLLAPDIPDNSINNISISTR
jgi:hypothetical protein